MKTVICVPRWSDGGRRDEIWSFTEKWIRDQYPYPIVEGHHEGPGEARDAAARTAGDWDMAIFHDADTLAHPEAIEAAVTNSTKTGGMTLACDSHVYLSEGSSNRILRGDRGWFCRPYSLDFKKHSCAFYARPCSGIFAVPRPLYEAVGGYPHAGIWGNEDQIWYELARIFSDRQNEFIDDHITLHLHHPPAARASQVAVSNPQYRRNHRLWQALYKCRGAEAKSKARQLLADTLEHHIP